jgi:hypothetical protein
LCTTERIGCNTSAKRIKIEYKHTYSINKTYAKENTPNSNRWGVEIRKAKRKDRKKQCVWKLQDWTSEHNPIRSEILAALTLNIVFWDVEYRGINVSDHIRLHQYSSQKLYNSCKNKNKCEHSLVGNKDKYYSYKHCNIFWKSMEYNVTNTGTGSGWRGLPSLEYRRINRKGPYGCETLRFRHSFYTVSSQICLRLSALCAGRSLPPERSLVLIYIND